MMLVLRRLSSLQFVFLLFLPMLCTGTRLVGPARPIRMRNKHRGCVIVVNVLTCASERALLRLIHGVGLC